MSKMLKASIVGLIIILAERSLQLQASAFDDPFYLAGVVEFRASEDLNQTSNMIQNLKGYLDILSSKAANNLDIIVFPEATLNSNEEATFVPNPGENFIVPCDIESSEYHSLLVQLSCAAKRLSVYLVINLTEKEWCSTVPNDTRPCASTGLNMFNTNVVFDRKGAVISRYRKVHLYENDKNTTFVPEVGWFDTDFGIRFGHFICFDILFYEPAQLMVVHNGIKDFIFSTMWFSQLPFLTSLQFHQAWSYANNVNLLAAGASNPQAGSTGTGIYHGRSGIILAKMNQDIGERQLYVAHVPKYRYLTKRSFAENYVQRSRPQMSSNIIFKRDDLQNYETLALNLTTKSSLSQKICFSNTSFCCWFNLKWQPLKPTAKNSYYHYRLGVFNGLRSEQAAETNQLKNCALFSCIGEDIMDCGKLLDTNIDVVFENITIIASFPKAERFLLMPNNLNASIMPLPVNHFKWQETDENNTVRVRYELNTTTPNVMAFSIYGNYYDSIVDIAQEENVDDENVHTSAASLTLNSYSLGILLISLVIGLDFIG